jgi:hypothetical protein
VGTSKYFLSLLIRLLFLVGSTITNLRTFLLLFMDKASGWPTKQKQSLAARK